MGMAELDHVSGESGRVVVARLSPGEDLLRSVGRIAAGEGISSASVEAIGTLDEARMAFFGGVGHKLIQYTGRLELVSCLGNVSVGEDGAPVVHLHAVVSDGEGRCLGGHVLEGCKVAITAEVVLRELKGVRMVRVAEKEAGRLSLRLSAE